MKNNILRYNVFYIIALLSIVITSCQSDSKSNIHIDIKALEKFGEADGNEKEILGMARFMAVDKKSNLFALDMAFNIIKKFNKKGELIQIYGKGEGEGPGEFMQPRDIDVDTENNLYVLDIQLRRVTVFDSSAHIVRTFVTKFIPGDIAAFKLNEVFIIGFMESYEGELIYKYDLTKNDGREFILKFGERYEGKNKVEIEQSGFCGNLIKCKTNELYYSAFYPYIIRKYSSAGKLLFELRREVDFYKPPYLKRPETRYIQPLSGSAACTLVNNKYLLNLLFEIIEDTKTYNLFIDVWDLNIKSYLGIYNIDQSEFKFGNNIIGDVENNIYTNISELYPHIQKYAIEIGNKSKN